MQRKKGRNSDDLGRKEPRHAESFQTKTATCIVARVYELVPATATRFHLRAVEQ